MSTRLQIALAEGIARLTMDDSKVNALSPEMLSELGSALDTAEQAGAVVLLQGRERVFSAGFDLNVLRKGGDLRRTMLRRGFELAARMMSFPTPVVVACSGHALAMGSFLLLAADYRIGAEGDFKIGANEVAIGLTVPQAALVLCRDRLAPNYFIRAVATAEIMGPAEATRAGFLDRVVAADDLLDEALQVAHRFRSLDMAAHHATKLKARAAVLGALRAAIEEDDALLKES